MSSVDEAYLAGLEAQDREMNHPYRDLIRFQRAVGVWGRRNFSKGTGLSCAAGVAEEAGELADHLMLALVLQGKVEGAVGRLVHSVLKADQNIRGTAEEHAAKAQDAAGDLMVYLAHLFSLMGWDLADAVETCWNEVKDRDWILFPGNGVDR